MPPLGAALHTAHARPARNNMTTKRNRDDTDLAWAHSQLTTQAVLPVRDAARCSPGALAVRLTRTE